MRRDPEPYLFGEVLPHPMDRPPPGSPVARIVLDALVIGAALSVLLIAFALSHPEPLPQEVRSPDLQFASAWGR